MNENIVSKNSFTFETVIGRGGFGKVWKVIEKKTKIIYAVKEMSKVKIIDKKSQKSVLFERELLSRIRNSFIVNLIYSFQDSENLYLVMDFLKGGDLRYHICKNRYITEEQTKFFLGCLILGLEYIHSLNLIHRDIKPENLLMDSRGYLRITDFGISSIYQNNKKNAYDTSGTPGYMAPEVITGNNHCKVVDYFAMGIIGFELMMGERPYKGNSRKEIKEQMIMFQVEIKEDDIPLGWSVEAANFFNKLLIREPENRLGYNGINEIKNDEWFFGLSFKDLYRKKVISPYLPFAEENFDKKYCNYEEKNSLMTIERYNEIMNSSLYEKIFINYTYYPLADINYEKIKINNTNRTMIKKTKKNSKKNSPDKNILIKSGDNFKTNNKILGNIYHIRHISNDIGIRPETNTFIPLSNRKQEIRLNRIHKKLMIDFRLTNNNSDNYLKQYLNFSKHRRKKNLLFLTNINEKNSRSASLNDHTLNNRSLDKAKSSNNKEKKLRKEKMFQPIMKKIKLKLAKNIINKHIKSNNKRINNKINSNTKFDNNKNINITNNNIKNCNYFKLINNNFKNNDIKEIKANIYNKINSPKVVKSPPNIVGMNYIYSAKKTNKIINNFNFSNLYNINFNNSKNNNIITLNLNNNTNIDNNLNTTHSNTNNNTNNNTNINNTQNNAIHYHKINKNKTLDKLKKQKRSNQQNINKNSQQKQRNKLENLIHNLYTNVSIKTPLNSPKNKRISIPINNLSQIISPEMCNKIIKKNTYCKNSGQRPSKLVRNYQKSDIKPNKKVRKINLGSIRNLEIGNYLTKKNSKNKILHVSKYNNMNKNGNFKTKKNKKIINEKKFEFKVSIPTFPHGSLYNQFLTNQTINITLSNCFNNSTINEKREKIEIVKPFHRRYASNNGPIDNNNNINIINNTNNNNSKLNNININNNIISKNKIKLQLVNNN